MALPSAESMRLSYWIAWAKEHGTVGPALLESFRRRFPDVQYRDFQRALKGAERMMAVGERVAQLRPAQQLKEALGRGAQPDPLVGVSFLFHWQDANGHEYWNTVKVSATWETTIESVRTEASRLAGEIMGRYPGATVSGWETIPKVLWPFPEQL